MLVCSAARTLANLPRGAWVVTASFLALVRCSGHTGAGKFSCLTLRSQKSLATTREANKPCKLPAAGAAQ
jgi:LSD1 subclass zinc finger protein